MTVGVTPTVKFAANPSRSCVMNYLVFILTFI